MNQTVSVINDFLLHQIFIEEMITNFIAEKLGIEDAVDSNILGNNKKALNFDQKVNLILESDHFSIIDKSKISVYKEILKEFHFHQEASSVEESFTSLDKNDDFLLILYPQEPFLPRNEKLTVALYALMDDVSQLISEYTQRQPVKSNRSQRLRKSANSLSKLALFFSFLLFR